MLRDDVVVLKDPIAESLRLRLVDVITMGEGLISSARPDSDGDTYVNGDRHKSWRVIAMTILKRIAPGGHHESEFLVAGTRARYGTNTDQLKEEIAVLIALRDDFVGGYLGDVRTLLRAELFGEFIDQAQHLLENGYHQAAAVIVGAVLEDHLRKLCATHTTITLPQKPKLDTMNAELARVKEYDVLRQKQVTAWADIRNRAAHGEWDKVRVGDVEDMLRGVLRFVDEHRSS